MTDTLQVVCGTHICVWPCHVSEKFFLYSCGLCTQDSEMEAPGPRPVAAVTGTTICVEDLFYNVPTRKKVRLAQKGLQQQHHTVVESACRSVEEREQQPACISEVSPYPHDPHTAIICLHSQPEYSSKRNKVPPVVCAYTCTSTFNTQ